MTTLTTSTTIKTRSINVIASEIRSDWKNVYFGAVPYLQAMYGLNKVTDSYYYDSAESIIRYFLSNASSWRGDTAKGIKSELKQMVGMK